MNAHNQKPIVGLTSRHGESAWLAREKANYISMLKGASVEYVILAPDAPAVFPDGSIFQPEANGALPAHILEMLDGLILSGGGDVHPNEFTQELRGAEEDHISPPLDRLEIDLTRAAMNREMPIFGICRGCQVLNVAAGGGLVQHFDGHRSPNGDTAYHPVRVESGSLLHIATSAAQLAVNTFHHQGVDEDVLAPGFVASGHSVPDGWLVEALESRDHAWVLGVQWHPERTFELEPVHQRIWRSFFSACTDHRDRR